MNERNETTFTATIPGQAWPLIEEWREENVNYANLMQCLDDCTIVKHGRGYRVVIEGLTAQDLSLLAQECIDRGVHEVYMQSGPRGDAHYRRQGAALRDAGHEIQRKADFAAL